LSSTSSASTALSPKRLSLPLADLVSLSTTDDRDDYHESGSSLLTTKPRWSSSTSPTSSRLPQALVLSGLEEAKPSVQKALLDTLRDRRVTTTTTVISEGENGAAATVAEGEAKYALPSGFFVVAVVRAGKKASERKKNEELVRHLVGSLRCNVMRLLGQHD
jgi:hypothetical protein